MYIAVASENGQIYEHFGKCREFTFIETEEEIIISKRLVRVPVDCGDTLTSYLKKLKTDLVICGGIGSGGKSALSEKKIEFVCGTSGDVMENVIKYLSGEVLGNNDFVCKAHSMGEGYKCSCGKV